MTPTYFSIKDGVVKLERADMLINDRFPLAAWGNVDLGNERVNMVIGLTGAAIANAFGLNGIPKNSMLQLPLKGPLNGPSIDKAKAAARISSLVAQGQGGPHGLVLGTVLDIASGGFRDGSVPNPTTQPLPWANMLEESSSAASPGGDQPANQEKPKTPKTPMDQIQKGAGSLIKKLLR
jgi:hypothetical protein